jgi:hypothetical protein
MVGLRFLTDGVYIWQASYCLSQYLSHCTTVDLRFSVFPQFFFLGYNTVKVASILLFANSVCCRSTVLCFFIFPFFWLFVTYIR